MTKQEKTLIQVVLPEKLVARLDKIQEYEGMQSRTEAVRRCINYFFDDKELN